VLLLQRWGPVASIRLAPVSLPSGSRTPTVPTVSNRRCLPSSDDDAAADPAGPEPELEALSDVLEQLEIDHLEQGSRPPGHQEVVATVNLDPGLYEVELSTDEVGEDHAAKDWPRDARPRRERLPLIWGRIPPGSNPSRQESQG
jgi:hypothetical protein